MLLWIDLVSPAQVVSAAPHHVELTCGRPLLWLPALSTVWGGDRETTWCDRYPNGAWFTPDHCQMQCCGSPRIVGTTPSRWLFQDPQRTGRTCARRETRPNRISNWRPGGNRFVLYYCLLSVVLSYIIPCWTHYDCQILSIKRFYN